MRARGCRQEREALARKARGIAEVAHGEQHAVSMAAQSTREYQERQQVSEIGAELPRDHDAPAHLFAVSLHRHVLGRLACTELQHLVYLQPARQVVRDKENRHLSLELVDGPRESLRRMLVETACCLVED